MNGYLRIKNTDLYEHDGVTYWRNGGNIIGNVVKAVIEEDDVATETYYIESLKTAKAIMLDPDVKIGGLTASESKNGNFIIVVTEPADFTEYGGGAGLKITFIYGVNYYSIETVESNGDIKIYDPDGDAGTLIPDALPDTTDALAGDVLSLDADKTPVWARPSSTKRYFVYVSGGTISGMTAGNSWFGITFISDSNTETITEYLTRVGATASSDSIKGNFGSGSLSNETTPCVINKVWTENGSVKCMTSRSDLTSHSISNFLHKYVEF